MTLLRPSYTGDRATGSRESMLAELKDLHSRQGQRACADIDYHVHADNVADKLIGVFVDGNLVALQPMVKGNGSVSVGGLSDGEHSIKLIPHRSLACWRALHGEVQGSRIYLRWGSINDSDLAAYRIYWDAGDGGAADTLLATVTAMASDTLTHEAIGDGAVISVWGAQDDIANDQINLALTATAYSYTCTNGSDTGSGSYAAGDTISLPYGVSARIEIAPATSASKAIHVGPAREWLSPSTQTFTAGTTYQFAIVGVDAAGNEGSTPSVVRKVYFAYVPVALSAVARTWTALTSTLAVSWTAPGASHAVRVYTNYDSVLGVFDDHVNTDRPYTTITHPTATWSFNATGLSGLLKYYLRHVHSGVERKDCTLYSINLPPTAADLGIVLGTPYNVTATATAGGTVTVAWDYRYRLADVLTTFYVDYSHEAVAGHNQYAVLPATGTGYPVLHTSYCDSVDYVAAGWSPTYARVSAYDSASGQTTYSAWVTVTPDAAGPTTQVAGVGAVQQ